MTLIDTIETVLEEAKANKIKRIDIKEKSSFADFIIKAITASSTEIKDPSFK